VRKVIVRDVAGRVLASADCSDRARVL
jgi:hypothetical protein